MPPNVERKYFQGRFVMIFFTNSLFHHGCLMLNFFPGFYYIYGMERTIKISYEHPVSKWVDIDGSKVKPIYFLKAPFELLKIVRHYKLR